jgi:hypothetical protein
MENGKMTNSKLKPLYINGRELHQTSAALGFLQLSTDEAIAKKIYEATGEKLMKGFLPLTWNTAYIVQMRDAKQKLEAAKKPVTAFNMAMLVPSISQAAHQYFISNVDKIKGLIPENIQLPTPDELFKKLTPVLIVAGIGAAAFLLSQVKAFMPQPAKAAKQ